MKENLYEYSSLIDNSVNLIMSAPILCDTDCNFKKEMDIYGWFNSSRIYTVHSSKSFSRKDSCWKKIFFFQIWKEKSVGFLYFFFLIPTYLITKASNLFVLLLISTPMGNSSEEQEHPQKIKSCKSKCVLWSNLSLKQSPYKPRSHNGNQHLHFEHCIFRN